MIIPRMFALVAAAVHESTAHRWSPLTTVVGSDGTPLDGVENEGASLPVFVAAIKERGNPRANDRFLPAYTAHAAQLMKPKLTTTARWGLVPSEARVYSHADNE
ncbi:MAG: hypothetical protein ACKV19_25415 [Verrucomicrobiales bacterium]